MVSQHWYLLEPETEGTYWHTVEEPLQTDRGESFSQASPAPPRGRLMLATRSDTPAPDLFIAPGSVRVVSKRMHEILRGVSLPEDAIWLPVQIQIGRSSAEDHWALFFPIALPVLDTSKAVFKWLVPNKVMSRISKWVLRSDLSIPFDLFRSHCQSWICSQTLVSKLGHAGLLEQLILTPLEVAADAK